MARRGQVVACIAVAALVAGACSDDVDTAGDDSEAVSIDYDSIGLWDDGPCDESRDPLVVGLMTVFESPMLSLRDHAVALESAADAFNQRGGANGACIDVHTCDDGADADQAIECVHELDDAGVHATVNDLGTAAATDVSQAMAEAGIPRIGSNVTNDDWRDQNAYPLDASGTGYTFIAPQALADEGIDVQGIVRVSLAAAAALPGVLRDMYEPKGVTIPYDAPVPMGATDFSQYIIGAEDAGAGGVMLALGEQEAVQVAQAGQQLDTDLLIGSSLGSFPRATVRELEDFADQMVFVWSFPPATADLPVYEALRDDLAASGDEELQPERLKASAMRSWIGLYALLRMIRDEGVTTFTRDGIKAMLDGATEVPMLDIFGGEDWTPDLDHPGVFQRAGVNHWATYRWDPEAGDGGDFVEVSTMSFDEVLCGTPFGAPGPC